MSLFEKIKYTLNEQSTSDTTKTGKKNPGDGFSLKKIKSDAQKRFPNNIEQQKRYIRLKSSFGTPTGADPKTGEPSYKRLVKDTELPKSRTGATPSDLDYERVTKPTTKGGYENPNYLGAKAEKTKIYTEPKKVTVTRDGKKVTRTKLVPSEKGIRDYARRALEKRRQAGGEGAKQIAKDVETILKDPKVKADYAKKITTKYGGIVTPQASKKELQQIAKDLEKSPTFKVKAPLDGRNIQRTSVKVGDSKLIDTKKRRLRIFKKPVVTYTKPKISKKQELLNRMGAAYDKNIKGKRQRVRTTTTPKVERDIKDFISKAQENRRRQQEYRRTQQTSTGRGTKPLTGQDLKKELEKIDPKSQSRYNNAQKEFEKMFNQNKKIPKVEVEKMKPVSGRYRNVGVGFKEPIPLKDPLSKEFTKKVKTMKALRTPKFLKNVKLGGKLRYAALAGATGLAVYNQIRNKNKTKTAEKEQKRLLGLPAFPKNKYGTEARRLSFAGQNRTGSIPIDKVGDFSYKPKK